MIKLYIFGIFVSLLNRCDAIRCFECQGVAFPRDCTHVVECGADEYCSTKQIVTATGNVVFSTGCLRRSLCSSPGISLIGKRAGSSIRSTDITTCIACCKDDFCNRMGCGASEIPPAQRGAYCFNCDAALDAKTCSNVTVCGKMEVCMLYTPDEYAGLPQTVYKGQCQTQLSCDVVSKAYSDQKCPPLCCNTDFCNDHCGIPLNITMTKTTTHQVTQTSRTTRQVTKTSQTTHQVAKTSQTTHQVTKTSQTTSQVTQTSQISPQVTQTPQMLTTRTSLPTVEVTDRPTVPTSNSHLYCSTKGNYVHLRNANAELCVHIVRRHATYDDARYACTHEGGRLVILDTHAKSLLMRSQLAGISHGGFWIGARNFPNDNRFSWINGIPVDNSEADWEHGEPDYTFHGVDQHCVMMLSSSYKWHDTNCLLDHFSYICERT